MDPEPAVAVDARMQRHAQLAGERLARQLPPVAVVVDGDALEHGRQRQWWMAGAMPRCPRRHVVLLVRGKGIRGDNGVMTAGGDPAIRRFDEPRSIARTNQLLRICSFTAPP